MEISRNPIPIPLAGSLALSLPLKQQQQLISNRLHLWRRCFRPTSLPGVAHWENDRLHKELELSVVSMRNFTPPQRISIIAALLRVSEDPIRSKVIVRFSANGLLR